MINMQCRNCGFKGNQAKDFEDNDVEGERFCPVCGSFECFPLPPPPLEEPGEDLTSEVGDGVQP